MGGGGLGGRVWAGLLGSLVEGRQGRLRQLAVGTAVEARHELVHPLHLGGAGGCGDAHLLPWADALRAARNEPLCSWRSEGM